MFFAAVNFAGEKEERRARRASLASISPVQITPVDIGNTHYSGDGLIYNSTSIALTT